MSSNSDIDLKIGVTATADTSALDDAQAKIDKLMQPESVSTPTPSMPETNPSSHGLPTGDQEQEWIKVAEERERINRNLKDGYDDLVKTLEDEAVAIKATGKAGTQAGDEISQGAEKSASSVNLLRSAWVKTAGAIAMVAGAWRTGRAIGDQIADYIDKKVIAAEQKANAKLAALNAKLKTEREFSQSAYDDTEAQNRLKGYSAERKIVEDINDLYQQRMGIVERMSASRNEDLKTQQQILSAEKSLEESKIRQQVLTGQLTEAQGKKALFALEERSSENRLKLEAEIDAASVKAAEQKLDLARQAAEAMKEQVASMDGFHLSFTGADFRRNFADSAMARKGTAEQLNWQKSMDASQKTMNEGYQTGDMKVVEFQKNIQAVLSAQMDAAKQALSMTKAIEYSASHAGINPSKTGNELEWATKLANNLDEARGNMSELKDQLKQSEAGVKDAAVSLQNAVASKERGDAQRNVQSLVDAANRNEQAIQNRHVDNAEKMKQLSDRMSEVFSNVLKQSDGFRNSPDQAMATAMKGKIGDTLVSDAERIARQGYASPSEISKLKKDLQDLKDSRYPEEIKKQFTTMVADMLNAVESANKRMRILQTPAAAQETAKDRFNNQIMNMRAEGTMSPAVTQAINETMKAINDKKISGQEAASLEKTLKGLLTNADDKATKNAVAMISDFLKEYIDAQRRKEKEGKDTTKGTATRSLEASTLKKMINAMRDGKVDNAMEKPALEASLALLRSRGSTSQTSNQIISLLEQMINTSESTVAENAALKSQLNSLEKRVSNLASQAAKPRNSGR